jgi:hypothetical protein
MLPNHRSYIIRTTRIFSLLITGTIMSCSDDETSTPAISDGDSDPITEIDTTLTPCAIPEEHTGPYLLPTMTPPPVSDTAAWLGFFEPKTIIKMVNTSTP